MSSYEINLIFALLIGGLSSLVISDFFRKGGLWSKRARLSAIWRIRSKRFRRKNGGGAYSQPGGVSVRAVSWLFLILILALIFTITIAVLPYL